jgi:hypothetical protein
MIVLIMSLSKLSSRCPKNMSIHNLLSMKMVTVKCLRNTYDNLDLLLVKAKCFKFNVCKLIIPLSFYDSPLQKCLCYRYPSTTTIAIDII